MIPETRPVRLLARFATLGFALFGVGLVVHSFMHWEPADVEAYWSAAMRLRSGEALYPLAADVNAADVYRYAPWFAAAWVPLTYVPRHIVEVLWSASLVAASAAVAIPLVLTRSKAGVASGALLGAFLIQIASRGNVHPLMIAALAYGSGRRTGPLWIAAAASLKAVPLLYAIVYATRGEWARVAATVALTAVLVLPMLLFGVGDYTTDPGWSLSLYAISPVFFAGVAVTAIVMAIVVARARPRLAWLAVSVAAILTLPRYFLYELTFLAVAAIPRATSGSAACETKPSAGLRAAP